jgi:DNA modification methylase
VAEEAAAARTVSMGPAFRTESGELYVAKCEELLRSSRFNQWKGKVQLIFTSPPFPLKRKKRYGNLGGKEYLSWLSGLAPIFAEFLTKNGSIVLEMGNAWEPGVPVQSLLPIKALLEFVENKEAKLKLCQEFVCYNPARLPSPAQWVTIERIRVKDSFTRLWWMAKTERPDADNRRILKGYSRAMRELLEKRGYNSGARPSEHVISARGFLKEHSGAIRPNVIDLETEPIPTDTVEFANTGSMETYQGFCREHDIPAHPARMPVKLAEFFIRFLTQPNDLVMDPFSGSNTVGFAAQSLNRKWIAIEADACYAGASIARFDPEAAASLFPTKNVA